MRKDEEFSTTRRPAEKHTLAEWLERHYLRLSGYLHTVSTLNKVLPKLLQTHSDATITEAYKQYSELSDTERKLYDETVKSMQGVGEGKSVNSFSYPNEKIMNIIKGFLEADVAPNVFTRAIRGMMLSFVISKFEDFIADSLDAVFTFKPEVLRSGKSLTYEDILGHIDFAELKSTIVEREIDEMLRGSLDVINDRLKMKFNIDLSADSEWAKLVEAFLRRNCFVHNDSRPSKEYLLKVKPTPRPDKLEVDEKYLEETLDLLRKEAKFLKEALSSKFA